MLRYWRPARMAAKHAVLGWPPKSTSNDAVTQISSGTHIRIAARAMFPDPIAIVGNEPGSDDEAAVGVANTDVDPVSAAASDEALLDLAGNYVLSIWGSQDNSTS